MLKLIIMADDFTGALDTGVQFTKNGIRTLVTSDIEWDFTNRVDDIQVLVIDLESRHISPEEAYSRVYRVTRRAIAAGIKHFYKKTDSGLRGNIGSELAALLRATGGGVLPFIPAYPAIKRTTRMGRHYIQGVPVSRSVYGMDPYEPVNRDRVAEIIWEQEQVDVIEVSVEDRKNFNVSAVQNCIAVFDAESMEDLEDIRDLLSRSGQVGITAGCAGFAAMLPGLIGLQPDNPLLFQPAAGMMIISGSVNQVTMEQIGYAAENGYPRITLTPEEKLARNIGGLRGFTQRILDFAKVYQKEGRIIIDVAQDHEMREETDRLAALRRIPAREVGRIIAGNMAIIVKELLQCGIRGTLIVFGGDTLHAILRELNCDGIVPLMEIDSGTVLSKAETEGEDLYIISKSGGFGQKHVIEQIAQWLEMTRR